MKKTFRAIFAVLILFVAAGSLPVFAETVTYGELSFDKSDVNSFDRPFMNPYSKALDYTATGLEAASLLTPLFLIPAPTQDYW